MFRILKKLNSIVAEPAHELKGAQRKLRYLVDLLRHCAKQLLDDRAEEMAAALTYRTIFSLVPLFVLGLVVFRMFGGFDEVEGKLHRRVYAFFGIPAVSYLDELEPTEEDRAEDGESPDSSQDPSAASEDAERPAQAGPSAATEDSTLNGERPAAAGRGPPEPQEATPGGEEPQGVQASMQRALSEITEKVTSLSFTSIGIIGTMLFIYAAMALAVSVEYDFNIIFDSPRGRPWHLRIAIYWSIITLGSALLAVSLYATGQLVVWAEGIGVYGLILSLLSRMLAFLASWVMLFLLYSLMPNTRVYLKPALIGSLVAALMWETGKVAFQAYVNRALPYSALYGSLGLIPLFLFWVYISWLIVLFGLELSYTLQVMHGIVPTKPEEQAVPMLSGDPDWFIPLLIHIGRCFNEGKVIGRQRLAEQLRLPTRIVTEYAEKLEEAHLIHAVPAEADGDIGYSLARPPDRIRIVDVLELGQSLAHNREHEDDRDDWAYLDMLFDAKRNAAADNTLAHLIANKDCRTSEDDQPLDSEEHGTTGSNRAASRPARDAT